MDNAILVGNSDGIGLAVTNVLLEKGWNVTGISRRPSSVNDAAYTHIVTSVQDKSYTDRLGDLIKQMGQIDLCIYCAGIGELLDFSRLDFDLDVIDVNLMGMVRTVTQVVPKFVKQGSGHFIGLSSFADVLLSAEAPSYHASKAGFSTYLESLGLALKPKGVSVTNLRFGFVDTKMAKGDVKPFMMDVNRAVHHLLVCIDKKPLRYSAPRIAIPFVCFRRWMMRLAAR